MEENGKQMITHQCNYIENYSVDKLLEIMPDLSLQK